MPARTLLESALPGPIVLLALPAVAPAADPPRGAVIRLLAPPDRLVSGRAEIETLAIAPEIRRVVFYLDGEKVASRGRPPFAAKISFASPPREQTLEARAYGGRDRLLGGDTLVVNRLPVPFRARITAVDTSRAGTAAIEADVSVPRKAALERVELYLNESLEATFESPTFTARIEVPEPAPGDFVRVVAILRDGRQVEDVEVLGTVGIQEELDVNLIQLQVLVLKNNGAPVDDLAIEDFEILEGGRSRPIDRLYRARDVSLVLGLVLDSSGSMLPIWDLTQRSAKAFLERTVTARDRSFLVDFDTRLRLVRPLTGDLSELFAGMGEIEPAGGTALYDSILFSLLQFTDEPGRRALVVLTDGVDASSTSNPKRAVEFGRKLGVPVYIVALAGPVRGGVRGGGMGRSYSVQELKLLTDPTGGRLVRAGSAEGIGRAFAQINMELRRQYVLTYYTDRMPDPGARQGVTVRVKGRKDVEVRAVLAADQVN